MYVAIQCHKKINLLSFFYNSFTFLMILKGLGCQSSSRTENKKTTVAGAIDRGSVLLYQCFSSTFTRGGHVWLVWKGRWPWQQWQEFGGGMCMCAVPVLRLRP